MRKQRLFFLYLVLLMALGYAGGERAIQADASTELTEETRYIALTFDDGPRRSTTTKLLDGLRERGASATFFLVGEQIEANRDLVERMKAEGHQVGNHTWSHVQLQGASQEVVSREIKQTDDLLRQVLGEGTYWLRPPYGKLDETQKALIPVPTVQWSVDSRDWESKNTEKILKTVLAQAKPNSIILMHDIYPTSVEAALKIVDALQKEGYWFVTVEELLRLNGIEPQAGVLYRSGE